MKDFDAFDDIRSKISTTGRGFCQCPLCIAFCMPCGASGISELSRQLGKILLKIALDSMPDVRLVYSELAGQKRFLKSTAVHPSTLTNLSVASCIRERPNEKS